MIKIAESHIKNTKITFDRTHSCRILPLVGFRVLHLLMLLMFTLLVCTLVACTLTGCGTDEDAGTDKDAGAAKSDKIKVVAAIAPVYDWTKNIITETDDTEKDPAENKSEKVDLTLLLDKGVDLHSYQPSAEDLNTISSCDLFIYVGGESDKWVSDALAQAENKDMRVICLMDVLGDKAKEEEHKEGMQEERSESSGEAEDGSSASSDDNDSKQSNTEESEYDEHVWLSLRNAELFTNKIAQELEELEPENAGIYKKNAADYISRLDMLDKKFTRTINNDPEYDSSQPDPGSQSDSGSQFDPGSQSGQNDKSSDASQSSSGNKGKTLLFADRFPFRYLTDDYGLDYYAAFNGCSSESEASFETMTFLAGKLDELSLKCVMTIDGSDKKMAHSVIDIAKTNGDNRDFQILTLDSMQSSSKKQIDEGDDYLSVMEKNLKVLEHALN